MDDDVGRVRGVIKAGGMNVTCGDVACCAEGGQMRAGRAGAIFWKGWRRARWRAQAQNADSRMRGMMMQKCRVIDGCSVCVYACGAGRQVG